MSIDNAARNMHRGTGRTTRALTLHLQDLSAAKRALYVVANHRVMDFARREAVAMYQDGVVEWEAFEGVAREVIARSIVTCRTLGDALRGAGIHRSCVRFDDSCWVHGLVDYQSVRGAFDAYVTYTIDA